MKAAQQPPAVDPEPGWSQALADGAPGTALEHIEYARSGTIPWADAHRWAAAMTRRPVTALPDDGLFRGAPAVAFVLNTAQNPSYARALAALDPHVDQVTRTRLEGAHARIDAGLLPELREWDLVSGLTGLGAYQLARHGDTDLLRDVLAYLVRLTDPVTVDGEVLPGWWCANGPVDLPSRHWPGGHANLGLAHGISGPLALLSTVMRHGIRMPGQADTIAWICTWLDRHRQGAGARAWWPGMLSRAEWQAGAVSQRGPQRPSWCYGTPGQARAQQLAGLALDDTDRQQLAEDALAGCVSDPAQLFDLTDATLCHGWAGLLLTTWRAAADARDDRLARQLPRLRALMDRYLHGGGQPEAAGLLEGTAGLRLAQHTTTVTTPPASRWDACLLLAG
ncbi:lanthionine synthetase C family protein [Kitasatospora atroaurantiaca]|uniref:Lanthionine synthetase-like protein n=1 Tax=Kitasatospora atroaurantiaca TaxID=285545 RepID=A0A561ENB3_9ACTN|nr:lanthionine synthetase C family protein [Kitasatospora atroaurantiaca]TWE17106.1 lanthionine synthetase-like protein [Kitasatospora atroaurantiaca]